MVFPLESVGLGYVGHVVGYVAGDLRARVLDRPVSGKRAP
jgi:hypothetical protein